MDCRVVDQGCKRTPIQGLADVGKDAASERLIFNRPAQITGNIVFAGQVCRMGYEVRCDDAIAGVGEYTDQGIANASRSTGYKYNLHGAPRSPNSLSMASRLARRTASLVRSEEHTSELQSLMRISYAVVCLKKKKA